MLVEVFSNFPEGQLAIHVVPSRYRDPVQVRHWLLAAPEHVAQSLWHASQVLFDVFSNTLVATQAVGQVVPSRYLVPVHEEHSVFRGPSQFSHST